MKRRHFNHFNIAGFTYWEGPVVFNELKIGTKLSLTFEPTNKYDAKAVAIYYGEHKLGYIPKSDNAEISKLVEQGYGHIFETRINRISADDHPESQIGVVVHLLKYEE